MRKWGVLSFIACVIAFVACVKDVAVEPSTGSRTTPSPVNFDPALVPYDSLSTYSFFAGAMADLQPAAGLLPYAPITPLFSDGAHKSRFVWMPEGASAHYVSD